MRAHQHVTACTEAITYISEKAALERAVAGVICVVVAHYVLMKQEGRHGPPGLSQGKGALGAGSVHDLAAAITTHVVS